VSRANRFALERACRYLAEFCGLSHFEVLRSTPYQVRMMFPDAGEVAGDALKAALAKRRKP
jgi:hypothetical protein